MKTTLTHLFLISFFLILNYSSSSGQFVGMNVPYGGQPSEIVSITNTDDNSLSVFAVASGRGIYKLDNTWKFLPVENEQLIRKLIPVNKNLYASFLDSGLYMSKDYAQSWIKILQTDSNELIQTVVETSTETIACSNLGRIFKTSDESNWNIQQIQDSVVYTKLFHYNGNVLFAASVRGLYRSDNSGDTWSLTDTSFFRSRNIHDIKATANNWIYVGTQRGLYRSKDEGSTWEELSNGIFVDNINCIYVYNDSTLLIGTAIGSYFSTDLGDSWTEIDKKTDVVNVNSFVKTEDSKLLAAASYGIYSGSVDFTVWEEFNDGFENLFFQKFIPIMSNGNINILLSSDNKNLYRSDNSQNWIKKFVGLTYNTFSMSPWNYLYLSSGMGGVLRSTDYGESFEQFYSNNSRGINCFAYDSKGNVYGALNGLSVVITTNQSQTWEYYNNGIENQRGNSLAIDSKDNKYVVTNMGFYWIHADSINWHRVNLTVPIPKMSQVFIGPDDAIYIISDSLGLFKINSDLQTHDLILKHSLLKKVFINRFNQMLTFTNNKVYYFEGGWDSLKFDFSSYNMNILDAYIAQDNYVYILTRTSLFKSNTVTAVEQPLTDDYLKIDLVPNPTSEAISIRLLNTEQNDFTAQIYGSDGKKYIEKKIGNDSVLDISYLTTGVYFLMIDVDKTKSLTRKFIKF